MQNSWERRTPFLPGPRQKTQPLNASPSPTDAYPAANSWVPKPRSAAAFDRVIHLPVITPDCENNTSRPFRPSLPAPGGIFWSGLLHSSLFDAVRSITFIRARRSGMSEEAESHVRYVRFLQSGPIILIVQAAG